ncbi:hypothetical protein PSI9734_01650 [Pseudidiomarina piscicola]|uniref:Uncharacterized protein n=1 Tax=Pseudidiomarina piscicola TaxID=2614830 RepID=A0A6S6WQG5_9GAMM|nr:hypothetical protein PSI9734_01650 [Pseudidiomarina piscicola]VZT40743.1 hypothetical protein PSI9734_01650 [Pseudomonas aeruginosa]
MYRPREVDQAVIAIWITLGLSVAAAIVSKWMSYTSAGDFIFTISVYGLFCLLPFHINRGSNVARWIYSVLAAFSIVLLLGLGLSSLSPPDAIVSVIMVPIEIFAVVRLFQPTSADYFDQSTSPT